MAGVQREARGRTRTEIAARLAQDIPDGWHVNLGIGIPTLVAGHIPNDRDVFFHSENGILGIGPAAPPDAVQPWLINAGKVHVTLRDGASFMDSALSFGIIRGRHLDLCVLGAFQVAENGDVANWSTLDDRTPGIGGAMDLAVGAKRVWVVMEHTDKNGNSRLVQRCTYPLTARGAISRVYTNLAVLEVSERGFEVVEIVPGISFQELQAVTAARLYLPE